MLGSRKAVGERLGLAGLLLGVLVGGVGGRLAMMLLARLNPRVAGVVSDDGFVMGQFTLTSTAVLLVIATALISDYCNRSGWRSGCSC